MSSSTLPVSLVCCGLLGTTADDHGILERAFAEACATQGIVPGTAAYAHYMVGVHQAQGQSAVDVFRGLFPDEDGRAEAAALSFERSFRTAVDRTEISPVPGAEEAISQLSESGLRVCLITSLSRRLLGLVLDSLRWWRLIDLTLCPEDAPRGCPWPDLMLTAMLRLGVEDVREAAFAASTASEIQCGRRSGPASSPGCSPAGTPATGCEPPAPLIWWTESPSSQACCSGAGRPGRPGPLRKTPGPQVVLVLGPHPARPPCRHPPGRHPPHPPALPGRRYP